MVLKVKYSKILVFKAIFLCRKLAESYLKKNFIEVYKNGRQTLLTPYFDNYDFQWPLFSKNAPNFRPLISNQAKLLEHFYDHFHRPLALLTHNLTQLRSAVQVRSQ